MINIPKKPRLFHMVRKYHNLIHYYLPRLFGYKNGRFYTCHNKFCWAMKYVIKYQNYK